uniref:Uncharacterized protein n=1 Tax=Arundo donax TaxID=35708 RepID=A0A0A8ZT94_ARUDO
MMVLCQGSDRCCSRLSNGPLPVTLCWIRNPRNASIASLPATHMDKINYYRMISTYISDGEGMK